MDYYQYSFKNNPEKNEVLIAMLSQLPFDTFEEVDHGFNAFVPAESESPVIEESLLELQPSFGFSFEKSFIKGQNWNKIWESNFHTVIINDFCGIRADFHPSIEGVEHELVINPKMAFGTGHHETTASVIELMRGIQFDGKAVLDYGCGTGVLAILAGKLGATKIEAVDVEIESYRNTLENAKSNQVEWVEAVHGKLDDVKGKDFDIILANINRNVILDSLAPLYILLKPGGLLVVSGFVKEDEAKMEEALTSNQFKILETKQKNNWLAMKSLKLKGTLP